MIPIGTDVRLRQPPVGNYALIAANVLVFMLEGVVHPRIIDTLLPPLHAAVPTLAEYVTYQFRHGDIMHLLGNMLFLWIFGGPVCDRMGSLNYVLFYLAGGVFAGVVFSYHNPSSMIGASGAIAAVTAAFLVLYPRVHITLLIFFFIITTIRLPAMILILFKVILWDNVIAPGLDRGSGVVSNVAYTAHLGGYAFGFIVALVLLVLRGLPRNQFDLLALWDRWSRRTGIGRDLPFFADRPVRVVDAEVRTPEPEPLTPVQQLREDILDRLSERDYGEALELYHRLRRLDPEQVLPRTRQLELANWLAQSQRQGEAIQAYQDFLRAYPNSPDAAQVHLFVGLLSSRYLHEYEQAAEHLRAALQGLTLESQRRLAQDELAQAEAHLPHPPPPDV